MCCSDLPSGDGNGRLGARFAVFEILERFNLLQSFSFAVWFKVIPKSCSSGNAIHEIQVKEHSEPYQN